MGVNCAGTDIDMTAAAWIVITQRVADTVYANICRKSTQLKTLNTTTVPVGRCTSSARVRRVVGRGFLQNSLCFTACFIYSFMSLKIKPHNSKTHKLNTIVSISFMSSKTEASLV